MKDGVLLCQWNGVTIMERWNLPWQQWYVPLSLSIT